MIYIKHFKNMPFNRAIKIFMIAATIFICAIHISFIGLNLFGSESTGTVIGYEKAKATGFSIFLSDTYTPIVEVTKNGVKSEIIMDFAAYELKGNNLGDIVTVKSIGPFNHINNVFYNIKLFYGMLCSMSLLSIVLLLDLAEVFINPILKKLEPLHFKKKLVLYLIPIALASILGIIIQFHQAFNSLETRGHNISVITALAVIFLFIYNLESFITESKKIVNINN